MRALLSERPGPPETLVLREVAAPEPGEGEVRIRVRACGINYPDVLVIEDRYQFRPPRPFAPGIEIAGMIETLGPGAGDALAPGMRVVAQIRHGGLAEQAVAAVGDVHPIADATTFEDAAALLLTYATSHHALTDRAGLRPGETLLVLGAAGGVGLAAVELGKIAGARVVAAASSATKAAAAAAHGADETIVYPVEVTDRRALSALFKSACPGGADVIYDPVGGAYAEPALRAIAWEGRYLVVGFPAGIPAFPANLALLKGCHITGVFWGGMAERDPAHARRLIAELLALHAAGRVRPLISRTYPLERGGEAIAALRDRTAIGKLVVTVTG